jgi:hypothetical protein
MEEETIINILDIIFLQIILLLEAIFVKYTWNTVIVKKIKGIDTITIYDTILLINSIRILTSL